MATLVQKGGGLVSTSATITPRRNLGQVAQRTIPRFYRRPLPGRERKHVFRLGRTSRRWRLDHARTQINLRRLADSRKES